MERGGVIVLGAEVRQKGDVGTPAQTAFDECGHGLIAGVGLIDPEREDIGRAIIGQAAEQRTQMRMRWSTSTGHKKLRLP